MAHYIDGFVFPIPSDRLEDYRRLAEAVAKIWKEHGALDYREHVLDDMCLEGTRSFIELAHPAPDECVVFGWVTFESRQARDLANERVAADPRVADLMTSSNSGFDPRRMVYGGFSQLVPGTDARGNQPDAAKHG